MKLVQEVITRTVETEKPPQVPVACSENFLLNHRGFNYYGIDLRDSDFSCIEEIVSGCEVVESDTWRAQEDFFDYIKKSDLLVYAEKDGQIVGFSLVSLMLINEYCFYTIDEAMVRRSFQGKKIARNIVSATMWWFIKTIGVDSAVKKFVMVSISSNPKVVNNYFKNKYVSRILDNSFYPSTDLINVHRAYLAKKNFELVNTHYPFCVKNLFPVSQRLDWRKKEYQFLEAVKNRMPPEFDHARRGDAFAFMIVVRKWLAYSFVRACALSFFGMQALSNNKLGLLRKIAKLETRPPLTRIRLIDGKFIDRRTHDRRQADRRIHNAGCDAHGVDRRVGERRVRERRRVD